MTFYDNYDTTSLEITIKPKLPIRVGRLTIINEKHDVNHSIDLDRAKLIELRNEIDRIIGEI